MTPVTADTIELAEIVDAIADADVLEDSEKAALLKRIDAEQGIVSDALRQDIVSVFRRQADAESARIKENDQLRKTHGSAVQPTGEDLKEADAVLLEAEQAQAGTSKEVEQLVDSVRADVARMERSASTAAETVRRKSDERSIDEIRRNLSSDGTTAA